MFLPKYRGNDLNLNQVIPAKKQSAAKNEGRW